MVESSSFDRRDFLKATFGFGLLGGTGTASGAEPSSGERTEVLVGVTASASGRRTAKRALPSGARTVGENPSLGYVRAVLPKRSSRAEQVRVVERASAQAGIEYVEPNATYQSLSVPNDPRFGDQHAPAMVNAAEAWDTAGDRDVTIAVVDQGIALNHPDLRTAIAANAGRDFVDDDDPSPDSLTTEGHGTHVAGIAAAETDNDTGIAGISDARLLSVRALSEAGSGYTSDIADGIQWAADNGVDVINLSLGGGGYSETMHAAVEYATQKGALLVAAAGNNDGSPKYPAAYGECIAVSALDPDGSLASYSSTGSAIELCAPGTNVLSTRPNDGYGRSSGTSMAAPVVSGVAALVLSREDLSNEALRSRLADTAADIGLSSNEQGAGRVDAKTAIDGALSRTLTIEGTGSYASYDFTVSGDLAGGEDLTGEDAISGSSATGAIRGGRDSYTFTGEVSSLSIDGTASVSVDGERITPPDATSHTLTIEGSGSYASYDFTVSGDLASGESLTGEDVISGSSATGAIRSGHDSYTFTGEVIAVDIDNGISVYLDGRGVDPAELLPSTLTIEGTGSYASYDFTVSGDLAGGEDLTGEDATSGSSATGAISGGRDTYFFSGEVTAMTVDGESTVLVDGTEIERNR